MGQTDSTPDTRTPCRYGLKCKQLSNAAHCSQYSHPGDLDASRKSQRSRERTVCRYGAGCRDRNKAEHCELYSHPGEKETDFLSQPADQHVGTKFPRVQCREHPGCSRRTSCWYSHGLVHTDDSVEATDGAPRTCFLGKAPHNKGCRNPIASDDPFAFCSAACRDQAQLTPKGPLGCRRSNCVCPCTVNGIGGQFCCIACERGTPCRSPVHTRPTTHLKVVARPQVGKYAPCAREGCACACEGGSSWDGKLGSFCCRACRNGTPCTKLWHTLPLAVIQEQIAQNTEKEGRPSKRIEVGTVHDIQGVSGFPDYADLFRRAEDWAKAKGARATKGPLTAVWPNESLSLSCCTARQSFERAVTKVGLTSWDQGEFGWHGTKSTSGITSICWANWDPTRRSGQAFGPGEYFSRGTASGLLYSEGYAGGDAANLLVVAWVMSAELGGKPQSKQNYALSQNTGLLDFWSSVTTWGHIVCNNPVDGPWEKREMYCLPVAVVGFGVGCRKPNFCMDEQTGVGLAKPGGSGCSIM